MASAELRPLTDTVIVDTGPLVAFLNLRDRHHAWSKAQLRRLSPPLLTCEAVLSEAAFLLQRLPGGSSALLELVSRRLVVVRFSLEAELQAVGRLMKRYKDVPISLADACLVRMSETTTKAVVFTLDSDFSIYRRNGRQPIPLIAPSSGRRRR